jgi:Na+-driven multidrug efflux pump
MAFSGVYQASGNTMISMSLTLFSQWVLQLPLAYLLSKHTGFGMRGIWLAFPITNVVTAGVSWLVFKNGYWKKKKLIKQEEKMENAVTQKIMAEEAVPYDY